MKCPRILLLRLGCIALLLSFLQPESRGQMAEPGPGNIPKRCLPDGQSARLLSVQPLAFPADFAKYGPLPGTVDNSQHAFMRPVFEQPGSSCNQSAGIGYTYTYEINRLRGVSAGPGNRYAPLFLWNFQNLGDEDNAACIIESWEAMKRCGVMSESDYGGITPNGFTNQYYKPWISGYEKYHRALSNKVEDYYMIKVGTPQGLEVLKHWMYDHLEGSSTGGLANVYAGFSGKDYYPLPPGSAESGKMVFPVLDEWVNHCITLVGYNDLVCWDYNGDGQFTNHLDITGDGIVDMRDWEKGGLKFVNTWGPDWADSGYCYLMYRQLALSPDSGGIWNQCVYVVKPSLDNPPLLTFRISLSHTKRNMIRLRAGVSRVLTDTIPQHIIDYPVFNYQGGELYPQGGPYFPYFNPHSPLQIDHYPTKYIEIAMDVSPLLSHVEYGQQAVFFLVVDERDPYSEGSGEIHSFCLVNHAQGDQYECLHQEDVAIGNNKTTILKVNHRVFLHPLRIADDYLPPGQQGEPYYHQMTAVHGKPPLRWKLQRPYSDSTVTAVYPPVSGVQLFPAPALPFVHLDFPFPFYGQSFQTVYPDPRGFLQFEENTLPYPYLTDEELFLQNLRCISAFFNRIQNISYSQPGYLFYEGDNTQATFWWKTSCFYPPSSWKMMNFALRLYPDGCISFFYDSITFPPYVRWFAGLSNGDGYNFHLAASGTATNLPFQKRIDLSPVKLPADFAITPGGILSGTPDTGYCSYNITLEVEDAYLLQHQRTFPLVVFGTSGLAETESPAIGIRVFPVPCKEKLTISIDLKQPMNITMNISDVMGRTLIQLIHDQHFNSGIHYRECATEGLPPGVYYYTITTGLKVFSGKIIKL